MQQEGHICVFSKVPRTGDVKTRLAQAIGCDGAAALAEAFIKDTWSAVSALPWAKVVIASTDPSIASVVPGDAEIWPQGDGDLGARLERILSRALESSPFAIAIGADSPGLPSKLFEQARSALRDADAAIGPAEDGGFYLLALRRCPTGLLAHIPWSQANTLSQTLARLRDAGLNVRILEPWFDVDRPEDLERLKTLAASGEIEVPKTMQVLDRIITGRETNHAPRISVIIPVLNEREALPQSLATLRGQNWVHELIVVDGGSTDGTREWLDQQADGNLKVIHAERGRGSQINSGAVVATGDVFLFLHADCLLPLDAFERISQALVTEGVAGGCFRVRFAEQKPRSLALIAAGMNLRTRIAQSVTGDQAIFVRQSAFERIGGFNEWPLFEDVDFVSRLKKSGKFNVVPSPVTISARRHIRGGVLRTALLVHLLRVGYWAGISPITLAKWYQSLDSPDSPLQSARGD